MTPTPEQVEAERERAHATLRAGPCQGAGFHGNDCTRIATALASRAIEALTSAEEAVAAVQCASKADIEVVNDCLRAIRALRGTR